MGKKAIGKARLSNSVPFTNCDGN